MNETQTVTRAKTPSQRQEEAVQTRISTDKRAADEAQRGLQASSYPALRRISCEHHEGMLVLRGKVPTFYMKQLAQEAVRKIEGVGAIVNSLEVGDDAKEHFQEE